MTKAELKIVRSLRLKKFRDEHRLFVAEGAKCVSELEKAFEIVYRITDSKEIQEVSTLTTPPDVIGVFRQPDKQTADTLHDDLVLCLDCVQDPGNLGTIIRTADWFGIRHIVCSNDTADCFAPKVVQATMGALARVHVHYTDIVDWLKKQQTNIYGTLLDGQDMYNALPEKIEGIVVMGNEGNGLSQAVRQLVTTPIRIPSYPKGEETSESLNVAIATAIVLAECRRRK